VSAFLWGTATSGYQVEGGDEASDWSTFRRVAEPAGRACAFTETFEADLDRAASLGTNAFRFSLEWAKVEPRPGARDAGHVRFYERLVAACRARGLAPVLTLSHFTLPRWCEGGWLEPRTVDAFERHVAWVARAFGGDVTWFVTVNEPTVQAGAGYLSGVFPPGRRLRPDLAGRCLEGLLRGHARAYRALHAEVPAHHPGRRPVVTLAHHVVAWRPAWPDPFGLRRRLGERFDWALLDAICGGEEGAALRARVPEAAGTLDVIGLNYYMALPTTAAAVLRVGGLLPRRRGPGVSDLGWPIDARGLEELLVRAHVRYGRPLVVTENGVADADDRVRPDYLRAHVDAVRRARRAGADVRGYLHWSLIDNVEWHEGRAPRFGLFAVDYATQARTPRGSCEVYRELIAAGPDAPPGV
jgi:beta-glucosidase